MIKAVACERNKQPILEVLQQIIDPSISHVLEIASGTGQHVTFFAKYFTNVSWQPTDVDLSYHTSISKYIEAESLANVLPPIEVDISKPISEWPDSRLRKDYDLMFCSNMIHIAPWKCSEGLFRAAGHYLSRPDGILVTYGPYAINGILTPESNQRFDESLRSRDSSWGVRDTRDLQILAASNKLKLDTIIDMPANNKIIVWKRINDK